MSDKIITDFFGNPIGRVAEDATGKKTVTDWSGKILGYSDKNGTRDFQGNPISQQDQPGLLLEDEDA